MSFKEFLVDDDLFDFDDAEKDEALGHLTRHLCRSAKLKRFRAVVDDMFRREEAVSSFVGQGIAIPRATAPIEDEFVILVARNLDGIHYDAARKAKVYVVVLVLFREDIDEERVIELLAELSTFFKDDVVNSLIMDENIETMSELFRNVTNGDESDDNRNKDEKNKKAKNEPLISTATALAREVNAKALIIFSDAKQDTEFLKSIKTRRQVIIITGNKSRFVDEDLKYDLVQAPVMRTRGMGQVKIGILLALSRNILSREDRVVCVTGTPGDDRFTTVMVVDIELEFDFFFTASRSLVPADVKPEILERVLGLASEIGMEGREGKALGTIFVLGDTNSVNAHISQLIINPFRGYGESERNILDPGLEETIKEFSSIDGAFVITGDGVVLSAGSYLRPSIHELAELPPLPSGLGSRHAAAAGITACTNALAITVSESTGQVTVFKNGAIALTLTRQVGR